MNFHPAPPESFAEFYRVYHARCRARCPGIRAVAAKWTFEDLIPGLSDFDTRFICDSAMTADDWARMSLEVGHVHTELCVEYPHWARNLEHLPGINLTVAEIQNPILFYPEFQQWTFYEGDAADIQAIRSALGQHVWSDRDQLHHLKKFATFCGPYQRGIDPPVNLGPWENKYPLHSRFMHYFAPPMQSAVSLALKRNVPGKLDAFRLARDLFPDNGAIDMVFHALEKHYELPDWYQEPRLTQIENQLEQCLSQVWQSLGPHLTLVTTDRNDDRAAIRAKVAAVPVDPIAAFFESAKFGRLMKGRLLFYASNIAWFDSTWPIINELGRIVTSFYATPLKLYAQACLGQKLQPAQTLEALRGNVLTAEQCDGMNRFALIASQPLTPGSERLSAKLVADAYDPVLHVLEVLSDRMLQHAIDLNQSQSPHA